VRLNQASYDYNKYKNKASLIREEIREKQQEQSTKQLLLGKAKIGGRNLHEIGKSLEKMGYEVNVNFSRSTKSEYLYLNGKKFKISDHTKTSTNPVGDFGVSQHDYFI